MRIISLSNAATPSFWGLPVQALGPWMSRIRHSLGQAVRHNVGARGNALTGVAAAASNDAVFAAPVLPGNTVFKAALLRVVRESDSSLSAECAGRMVMSGRMADVCAELDRMVLRAAAAAAQDGCVTTRP